MDRDIFEYHNGMREVKGDPLALERRLRRALGGRPNEVINAYLGEDEDARDQATETILAATREVLGMAPWDDVQGIGTQDGEVLATFTRLTHWLKKKGMTTGERRIYSSPLAASRPTTTGTPA